MSSGIGSLVDDLRALSRTSIYRRALDIPGDSENSECAHAAARAGHGHGLFLIWM